MTRHQITIPIFIPHLGCPHRCIFCDQQSTTSATKAPGPEMIDDMIQQYMHHIRAGVKRIELAFFGGSFTGIRKDIQESYLKTALRHLEANNIHGIRLSTRPDYITDESLALLEKYKVAIIEIGVQSLDDAVLSSSNRGHKAADVFAAVDCVKNHGFDFVIQLMPGLPGETRVSALHTARLTAEMGPSAVRIYPAVVLKGTGLEPLYTEGKYSPLSIEDAVDLCKDLYQVFAAHGIPVIRLGLHPLSPAQTSHVIAGPYHPSFGYLVKSRIRRERMAAHVGQYLRDNAGKQIVNIKMVIPDKNPEEFIGNGKENINFLKNYFGLEGIRYTVGPVPDIEINA